MICLGLFAKVLGLGVKILNDLAKVLGTFIKGLRKKTKEADQL